MLLFEDMLWMIAGTVGWIWTRIWNTNPLLSERSIQNYADLAEYETNFIRVQRLQMNRHRIKIFNWCVASWKNISA